MDTDILESFSGSSFCSLRQVKLQNEDPRFLFDAKTKSKGSSFCSFTRLKLQNEDPFDFNVLASNNFTGVFKFEVGKTTKRRPLRFQCFSVRIKRFSGGGPRGLRFVVRGG